MKHYTFALACFVLSALILRAGMVDSPLPVVLDSRVAWVFYPPELEPTAYAKASAYCACPRCCGSYSDGITYSGTVATQGRTIAADPDVWALGTCLSLSGVGRRVVEDIGGAIQGRRIDVYFDSHTEALRFGVKWLRVEEC